MDLKNRKTPYYKGARLDGWDWYTGNTINYRENIGEVVKVPYIGDNLSQLCSPTVLHACCKPNNIFIGSKIPSSVYVVKGKPAVAFTSGGGSSNSALNVRFLNVN